MARKPVKKTRLDRARQYALAGAAIGLYFGLFFRPLREPSLAVVVVWGAAAAIVVVCLRLIRGWRPGGIGLLKASLVTYAQYAFVLAMLEGRHLAYNLGGQVLVIVMTMFMGAVAGLWFARGGATLLTTTEPDGDKT